MNYKRYRSIVLALLITTNIIAVEHENNWPRNIIVLSAFALVSIMLLSKIKSWMSSSSSFTTNSSGTTVSHNELIFAPHGGSTTGLPLTKPSGKLQHLPLNPIEHVKIMGNIAIVHIDDEQKPRIEIDEAFAKNLIFNVHNGVLTATTPDNQPRKFEYNGQPLCKIYAKLLTAKLIASDASNVYIKKQKLDMITSTGSSIIKGTVQQTHSLNLGTHSSSELNLNDIDCENITSNASGPSIITLSGKTTNQDINLQGQSDYNGSQLLTQNGFIRAQTSGQSNITVAGKAKNQNITLSGQSDYNGLNLCAKNTTVKSSGQCNVKLHVTEKFNIYASGMSSIRYKGNPIVEKKCSGLSDCKQIR